jgi:hypothetical protein
VTTDPHAIWKWIAITAVGLLLSLGGTTVGKVWSDHGREQDRRALEHSISELEKTIAGLDKRLEQAVNNVAGPVGISVRLTEISNRLSDLEGVDDRVTLLEAGGERYSRGDHTEYATAHDRRHAVEKEVFAAHAAMVTHRLGDLEARVRERGPPQ